MNDSEFADFEIILFDGESKIATTVHRLVLKTSSPYFRRILNSHYLYMYVLTIPKGSTVPALRLIRYFYSRDLRDLGDLEPTLRLCLQLECSDLYAVLNRVHMETRYPVPEPEHDRKRHRRCRSPLSLRFSTRSSDRKTRRSSKK